MTPSWRLKLTGPLLAMMGLISCVNVSYINTYSSASAVVLKKFDDIQFTSSSYCHEVFCLDPDSYLTGNIANQKSCDCTEYFDADKSISAINDVLAGYFTALVKLSATRQPIGSLSAITAPLGDLASGTRLELKADELKAATDLANLISRTSIAVSRKHKLRKIIMQAGPSVSVVISAQEKNILFLKNIVQQEVQEISIAYASMIQKAKDPGLIWLLSEDRNKRLKDLETQNHLLLLFNNGLNKIKMGHEQILAHHVTVKDPVFRKAILAEAQALQVLLRDFIAVGKR